MMSRAFWRLIFLYIAFPHYWLKGATQTLSPKNTTSIITVISRSGSHCLYLKSDPYQMALWRLFPEIFEAPHGAPPDIRAFPDYGAIASWVADRIRNLSEDEGYPARKWR